MPIGKSAGHLTELWTEDVLPAVVDQQIGCIVSVTPPGREAEEFQLEECLDDTGVADIEHGSELPNEVAFVWVLDPRAANTEFDLIRDRVADNAEYAWEIRHISIATKWIFNGKVKSFLPQEVVKRDMMKVDVVISRTGDATLAAIP